MLEQVGATLLLNMTFMTLMIMMNMLTFITMMTMLKMILLASLLSLSLVTTKPQLGPCLSPIVCGVRAGGRIGPPALGGAESVCRRRRFNNFGRTGAGFRGYGK